MAELRQLGGGSTSSSVRKWRVRVRARAYPCVRSYFRACRSFKSPTEGETIALWEAGTNFFAAAAFSPHACAAAAAAAVAAAAAAAGPGGGGRGRGRGRAVAVVEVAAKHFYHLTQNVV